MNILLFDMETNGFLSTVSKIHCIAYATNTGGKWTSVRTTTDPAFFLELVDEYDLIVGHNITGFDIPVLKKFYPDFKWEKRNLFDTMLGSMLVYPDDRLGHSIEAWAKKLGTWQQKIKVDDWDVFTPLMKERCKSDVSINLAIYEYLLDTWLAKEPQVMQLEARIALIHAEQERYGVLYDVEGATKFLADMTVKSDALAEHITAGVPDKIVAGSTVKAPYKQNGDLCKRAIDYLMDHVPEKVPSKIGPFSVLKYHPFNIGSDVQVKNFLLGLGWQPTEWNYNAEGRTSPKLTEDSYASLPMGLGKDIADYRIIMHRSRMIYNDKKKGKPPKGALTTVRDDGRIPAQAFTCATPTSRYRHQKTVCNIPRPKTPYGKEVRSFFTVPDDSLQIGIDLSGIEARTMCHYAAPYPGGDELIARVLSGDFHDFNADCWDVDREDAKSGLYALMYGCGEAKLASTLKKPKGSGRALLDAFWMENPALKSLIEDVDAAYDSGRMIRGVDRRVLSIRQKRMGLNTLFQGAAAVIFKHWMRMCDDYIMKYNFPIHQIIAYHDELQFELNSREVALANEIATDMCKLSTDAGELLKIKVPLDAAYKIGHNWRDCH